MCVCWVGGGGHSLIEGNRTLSLPMGIEPLLCRPNKVAISGSFLIGIPRGWPLLVGS